MKVIIKKTVIFLVVFAMIISCFSVTPFALTYDTQDIRVEWQNPVEIVNVEMGEKRFIVSTKTDKGRVNNLYFTFPTDGGVRFNADNKGFFDVEDLSVINYSVDGASIVMRGVDTKVKLYTTASPWRFEVYNEKDEMVVWYISDEIFFGYDENGKMRKVKVVSSVDEYETFFGLGERFNGFIQNGKTVEMWNADSLKQLSLSYGDHNVGYKNVPLLHSNNGYSVFHNNNYYGIVDVAETQADKCSFEFYGPILDMFVWTGSTTENINNYCTLTGSSVTVPKYALSYWAGQSQSMWYSKGEDVQTVLDIVQTNIQKYDKLNTPIKVIFMEGLGSNSAYTDIHNYLKSKEIKFLGWNDSSYRTFDNTYTASSISEKLGFTASKIPLVKWNYSRLANYYGNSGEYYIDYSNPLAKLWAKERLTKFMDNGLIGMMVDYNDSIITTDTYYPYLDEDGTLMHNLSQYYYSRTLYETFKDYYGEGNFVNIVRAGVAGTQSFGAVFGGDQSSTFLGLAQSVSALLSSASSGFNVWGSDIGGLGTSNDPKKNDAELYARWLAFGTFSPLMRTHGQSSWRDPWNYGNADSSNALFQKYYWTRESIVDLVNSGIIKANVDNIPLTQAMVVAFPTNKKLAANNSQYMFCDSLLVCPVTESGAASVKVQFPEGRWVNIWDGTVYEGDTEQNVSATTETIPVFLEAGSAFFSQMGEELRFGSVNTVGKNSEVLVTAPATQKKVNTIYKDNETFETIICDKLAENSFCVESENGKGRNIVVAMGCNADSVEVDGKKLAKLSKRPTSQSKEKGYYCDLENNTTIIVTGGDWTNLTYSDSTVRLANVALLSNVNTSGVGEKYQKNSANVTDGDYTTSLTLLKSKTASVTVELNEATKLDKILIKWGGNYAKGYKVEASATNGDDAVWDTLTDEKKGDGGTDIITTGKNKEYRYIRISNINPNSKLGAKLFEVEAYGDTVYKEDDGQPNLSANTQESGGLTVTLWYIIVTTASIVMIIACVAVALIFKLKKRV